MTIERYKELKKKYFCGPVYNNSVEMVKVGFFTSIGCPIAELDAEPGVQRWVCPVTVIRPISDSEVDAGGQRWDCSERNEVWYRVYAPQHMKYEEV